MRPIRDITDVGPESVLYHSAFGFARVVAVGSGFVRLDWADEGENLPTRVSTDHVLRVYALCAPDGFFHRAVHEREALLELLHVDPPAALALLLEDLVGPQRRDDLREWLVGRELMTEHTFDRWWEGVLQQIAEDERFQQVGDGMVLDHPDAPGQPHVRLSLPGLTPARRLDLALAHRDELDPETWLHHLLRAWTDGTQQVRDLALAASRGIAPERIVAGFLALGTESVDGIIHAVRRAGWEPTDVGRSAREALVARVVDGCRAGGPLDAEGRLTAVLYRWGAPEVLPAIAPLVGTPDGQQLVRATLATLPQRRAEELALELLSHIAERDATSLAAQWLGHEILVRAGEDNEALAARVEEAAPHAAQWFRLAYDPDLHGVTVTWEGLDPGGHADVDDEPAAQDVRFEDLPPRPPGSFLHTAIALARALADHHASGRIVNPSRDSTVLGVDGVVRLDAAPERPPIVPGEPPGPRADLHAAGVLLIETLLGRPWPRTIPAARVLPYLRLVAPDLPPTAIGVLDPVLHPDPASRPADAKAWLRTLQAAAVAEEDRAAAEVDGAVGLSVGYDTHVGFAKLLLTQTNQDAIFVTGSGNMRLLVVCDGISTATAGSGDVASGITAHVVGNLWEQALPRLREAPGAELFDFLDRALRVANTAVCEAALRFAGGQLDGQVPMGTTAVCAVSRGADVWLSWLGDSRAYLVGPSCTALLTADQNQAGDRLRAWQAGIDPYWDPAGYALVGYVGHFNDWSRPEALPPSHLHLRLLRGERLVMCSDGVSDYLADVHPQVSAIVGAATREGTLDSAARALIRLANEGGGGDNCTAIVAGLG